MFKQKLKRVREPAQKRQFPETGKGPKKPTEHVWCVQ